MIKLIATDMDGTLLDAEKKLPKEFPLLLRILQERQITFAIASGRSYPALVNLFGKAAEDLILICDNGGNVKMPGKPSVYQWMPFNVVHTVLDVCQEIPNVVPVLCCVNGIYYPVTAKEQFQQEISNFYVQFSSIPYTALYQLTDPVIKIALCAMEGPEQQLYPLLAEQFGKEYELVVSGDVWMDMMCKNVNKGNAIKQLQDILCITKEETMVFGDYHNDISMFEQAKYSYAMAQASDTVKRYARLIAPPHTENGVIRTICEKLQITLPDHINDAAEEAKK